MRAAVYERYGGPDVVAIREVAMPSPGAGEILVKVHATSVTTADWRLRAAAFPGVLWLPGHLIAGFRAPRKQVLGGDFSGRIVAVGAGVTDRKVGEDVFGFSGFGAHAEYLAMKASGPVVPKPAGLGHDQAAAVPFGALSALVFLRDFAKVSSGDRVLVVGGSGGVGVYAVQIARHLGATVDAVAGAQNAGFLRGLGARRTFDHASEDFTLGGGEWDVILDIAGTTRFAACKSVLAPDGRHVFLNIGLAEIVQALVTPLQGSRRVVIGTSGDTRDDLAVIATLLENGTIRPIIDSHYSLERIVEAHARVETRHKRGSVVVTVAGPDDGAPLAAN